MAYDVMMTNAVSSSLQTLLFANKELQTAQLQASSGLRRGGENGGRGSPFGPLIHSDAFKPSQPALGHISIGANN